MRVVAHCPNHVKSTHHPPTIVVGRQRNISLWFHPHHTRRVPRLLDELPRRSCTGGLGEDRLRLQGRLSQVGELGARPQVIRVQGQGPLERGTSIGRLSQAEVAQAQKVVRPGTLLVE